MKAPIDRWRLAGAAIGLLVILLFREALAGGVFYRRDVHLVWHPQVEAIVRAAAEGAWPVWDVSPAFGQPLLADPGAQVLYPPTWLNLVLRPWTYYTVFALGHVLLSSLSFLALLRRWGLSPVAAGTGAAAWTLSGPHLSLVDLWHHFAGLSFLPLAFLCADRALESRRAPGVVLLGLVLGLQVLAGSGDACAMTLVSLGVYALVVRSGPHRWREAGPVAFRLGAAVAVAAAVGAGVWLPALEAASRSARASLPEAMRTYWSAPPVILAETLLAGIPSTLPLDAASRARLYESREPFLVSLYLGLPCLVLAAGAVASAHRRRAAALALLLAAALLFALGSHAWFYDVLVALVPPLRVLRYPVKAMSVAAFAWAGLAALGVEAWRAGPSRRLGLAALTLPASAAVLAVGVAVSLLTSPAGLHGLLGIGLVPGAEPRLVPVGRVLLLRAALAGLAIALVATRAPGRRPRRVAAVAALAVADLALAHPGPNPTAPAALYTHRPAILRALENVPSPRVYSYNYAEPGPSLPAGGARPDRIAGVPAGWSLEAAGALAQQMSLAPQCAGRWRIRQGFDVDYRGLQAAPLATFTRLASVAEGRPEALLRLLRMASVTHVVALHDVAGGLLPLAGEAPGLFASPVRAWSVTGALPRARVVGGARVVPDVAAADVLLDPAFDAEQEVLLAAGAPRPTPASFAGSARILEERADRLRVEAELSSDGYLVVADAHDPGWRVRVDGFEASLLRANLAFRAVAVPAGRHEVVMVYRPVLALAAVAVTLASLAGAIAFLAAARRA